MDGNAKRESRSYIGAELWYIILGSMMEAELHLMDMVDRDKVSVVAGLRMYI